MIRFHLCYLLFEIPNAFFGKLVLLLKDSIILVAGSLLSLQLIIEGLQCDFLPFEIFSEFAVLLGHLLFRQLTVVFHTIAIELPVKLHLLKLFGLHREFFFILLLALLILVPGILEILSHLLELLT
jgi:hypothetical protein